MRHTLPLILFASLLLFSSPSFADDPVTEAPFAPGITKVRVSVVMEKDVDGPFVQLRLEDNTSTTLTTKKWRSVETHYGIEGNSAGAMARPLDVGGAHPLLVVDLYRNEEMLGSNDCDRTVSAIDHILFERTAQTWVRLGELEASRAYSQVWCREERDDGSVPVTVLHEDTSWTVLHSAPLTLQAVTTKYALANPSLNDEPPSPATIEVKTYEVHEERLSMVENSHKCPTGTTKGEELRELGCVDAESKRHGPYRAWHDGEHTKLAEQATYVHGQRVGAYAKWHESGEPKLLGLYDRAHKAQGTWYAFHENGVVRKLDVFKDGEKARPTLRYDQRGTVKTK